MTRRTEFLPFEAIAPGETLRETIEALNISQADLVRRMDRPAKTINEIIMGKAAITPETAIQLERVLGVPASFWNNLEKNYQLTLARLRAEQDLAAQVPHLGKFPYREMAKRGWVPDVSSKVERVRALLTFFGVNSLDSVRQTEAAAFRRSAHGNFSPEALAAWLRQGVLQAKGLRVGAFDAVKLRTSLESIRALTRKAEFDFEAAVNMCSQCGVALVAVPHLARTHVNGATRWINSEVALVQLSIRYRYEDIFWFSLFHELGHVLRHGKREVFVDFENGQKSPEELEADELAANSLIPAPAYRAFACRTRFSAADVVAFARGVGVSPGIVVGRLQHEGLVPFANLNGLRRRLAWKSELKEQARC